MGIFASVLKQVLAHHQNDPAFRDKSRTDPLWYPLRAAAVLPAVIDRLKLAADQDTGHATLGPVDFEEVLKVVQPTPEEKKYLQAALLAQGVEIFLSDRMKRYGATPQDATDIAQVVYESLIERFEDAFMRTRGSPAPMAEEIWGLFDRTNTFLAELEEAQLRQSAIESRFWGHLVMVALEDLIVLFQPFAPDVATALQARRDALP